MSSIRLLIFLTLIAAAVLIAAAHKERLQALLSHGHDQAKAAEEPGHGHGGGISVTHYTDKTELFVEYPPLAKGEESAFAAHLTHIDGPLFKAVSAGKLTVRLAGGGAPDETADAGVSATPGIFRPVLRPQHTGKRQLTFHLALPQGEVVHDLGEVTVHGDKAAAEASVPQETEPEGIKFTKEQQWKIEFANQPAGERLVRESITASAMIKARAAGEAYIATPAAGLLRPAATGFPQVGMKVEAGQVLAHLIARLGAESDTATLALAVERARIELEQARRERQRLDDLLKQEAIPAKRARDAAFREQVAQAELAAAQQRKASYQEGTGGIALKSPIAGTVLAVGGSPGAAVSEGQTIAHIADLDRLWIEARVPESELARVTTPAGLFFRLGEQGATYVLDVGKNAQLVGFGGLVDKDTRTVPAIFELDNPAQRLRIGAVIQAELYTGRASEGVAIPVSAVVDDNGQAVVFVQSEGELFQRRVVVLGHRDGDWIAVRSGIDPGDRVVTQGAYAVRLAATAPAALGHGHAH
jgi:membrane fusion protein, heavy metal efflux system